MARKPNYQFERMERQREKDAKKAARLAAKKEKSEQRSAGSDSELAADDQTEGDDASED